MKHIFAGLLLILTSTFMYSGNTAEPLAHSKPIVIPDSWIESANIIKKSDKATKQKLVSELGNIVYPGKFTSAEGDVDSCYLISIQTANLDHDAMKEYLVQYAPSSNSQDYYFAVIKHISNQWRVIYTRELHSVVSERIVKISNSKPAPNKVFYLFYEDGEGTGVLIQNYEFFGIVDGNVRSLLKLPAHRHNIYESIDCKFKFNREDINAEFSIVTYPARDELFEILGNDLAEKFEDLIYFDSVYRATFRWNAPQLRYDPFLKQPASKQQPTAEQLDYLIGEPSDSRALFVQAFDKELKQVLLHGSKEQKRMVSRLLNQQ